MSEQNNAPIVENSELVNYILNEIQKKYPKKEINEEIIEMILDFEMNFLIEKGIAFVPD